MKYSEKELAALISEVEKEFTDHLKKAEAETEQPVAKAEQADAEASQEVKAAAAEEQAVVEKSENTETPADEFDYSDEDVQEMDGLYSSMSKSEKEAHYKSVKKALFGENEGAETVEKTEENTDEVVAKTEEKENDLVKSEDLKKAEEANEALKKENEDLKKSFSNQIKKLNGFVSKPAPKQKAITKIEYVAKSEDGVEDSKKEDEVDVEKLTKSEISTRLNDKIRSGELKKTERELINAYYLEGKSIETIKHLL
jgi:hypothetical protein